MFNWWNKIKSKFSKCQMVEDELSLHLEAPVEQVKKHVKGGAPVEIKKPSRPVRKAAQPVEDDSFDAAFNEAVEYYDKHGDESKDIKKVNVFYRVPYSIVESAPNLDKAPYQPYEYKISGYHLDADNRFSYYLTVKFERSYKRASKTYPKNVYDGMLVKDDAFVKAIHNIHNTVNRKYELL